MSLIALTKNIRYHRKLKGWTQADLAEKCGATPAHIGHLERGDREPSISLFLELARKLGVNPGELLLDPPESWAHQAVLENTLEEIKESLKDKTMAELKWAQALLRIAFTHPSEVE